MKWFETLVGSTAVQIIILGLDLSIVLFIFRLLCQSTFFYFCFSIYRIWSTLFNVNHVKDLWLVLATQSLLLSTSGLAVARVTPCKTTFLSWKRICWPWLTTSKVNSFALVTETFPRLKIVDSCKHTHLHVLFTIVNRKQSIY